MNALALYIRLVGDIVLAVLLLYTLSAFMRRVWYIPLTFAIFFILLGLDRFLTVILLAQQATWLEDYGLTGAVWLAVFATAYGLTHSGRKRQ